MTTTPSRRLLRLPEVMERTGLRHDSIYRLARTGDFPKPRKITPRASGWLESEIDEWIDSRPVAELADIDDDDDAA